MSIRNINLINSLVEKTKGYDNIDIEASVISYVSQKKGIPFYYEDDLSIYNGK